MSSRRSKREEDGGDNAEERDQRKREREERKKQREEEGSKADAERQQAREDRRKKRESGEDTGKTRRQEKEEEEQPKKEEEEEENQRRQQEEEDRKRREQEQKQKEREEKEQAPPPSKAAAAADKTDGPKTAFDKIDDDRKRRIIDSLIDRLYELAEQKEAKEKPQTTASSGDSSADVTALDLKVRSLRTRVRNAENATTTLAKQQKDIEIKIKLNHQEVEKLQKEYAVAEEEYAEAVKNGGAPVEAPRRGRGAGGGKSSGFFDIVKKAQSSLWEDKFRAFKEKQRESSGTQPEWVNNLKKSDSHIIGTTVMKREDPDKKKEKAAWQNQPKLHKAVIDPRPKKEVEPTGAKKPAWSGVSLKKAEKK